MNQWFFNLEPSVSTADLHSRSHCSARAESQSYPPYSMVRMCLLFICKVYQHCAKSGRFQRNGWPWEFIWNYVLQASRGREEYQYICTPLVCHRLCWVTGISWDWRRLLRGTTPICFNFSLSLWSAQTCVQGSPCDQPRNDPLVYSATARELNPGHREDRQWNTFILSLSYHDPSHGEDRQWDIFILSLSYHDPGHREDRQWDTFILSLSYHDPSHGEDRQWDIFILSLSYHDPGHREDRQWDIYSFSHWAIMTRATERTDSGIDSFSHWAIMNRATVRTDNGIHSFSHWAIMTRATERTDSGIHSFSHWAIMTALT